MDTKGVVYGAGHFVAGRCAASSFAVRSVRPAAHSNSSNALVQMMIRTLMARAIAPPGAQRARDSPQAPPTEGD